MRAYVLNAVCIVESYLDSIDKTRDVMVIICDAPVIWWPSRGMRGMDLKRAYFRMTHNVMCT